MRRSLIVDVISHHLLPLSLFPLLHPSRSAPRAAAVPTSSRVVSARRSAVVVRAAGKTKKKDGVFFFAFQLVGDALACSLFLSLFLFSFSTRALFSRRIGPACAHPPWSGRPRSIDARELERREKEQAWARTRIEMMMTTRERQKEKQQRHERSSTTGLKLTQLTHFPSSQPRP